MILARVTPVQGQGWTLGIRPCVRMQGQCSYCRRLSESLACHEELPRTEKRVREYVCAVQRGFLLFLFFKIRSGKSC